jgi:Flp pilus assembly pilin Flp
MAGLSFVRMVEYTVLTTMVSLVIVSVGSPLFTKAAHMIASIQGALG